MAILERVFSEADLISWGSIELHDAHPDIYIEKTRMHSHDAYQAQCDVHLYMRTHGTQTSRRSVHALGPIAAQVQAYIVRREQTSALSILYGSGATVLIRKVKDQAPCDYRADARCPPLDFR